MTKNPKIIELGIHGIVIHGVHLGRKNPSGAGMLFGHLHEQGERRALKAAWDALESMVLAHAVAGVDVTAPAYKEGLETAIDAVQNEYGDDGGSP